MRHYLLIFLMLLSCGEILSQDSIVGKSSITVAGKSRSSLRVSKKAGAYKAYIYTKNFKMEKGILYDISDSAVFISKYHSRKDIRSHPARKIPVDSINRIVLKNTSAAGRGAGIGAGIGLMFGGIIGAASTLTYLGSGENPAGGLAVAAIVGSAAIVLGGLLGDSQHTTVMIYGQYATFNNLKSSLKSYCFIRK